MPPTHRHRAWAKLLAALFAFTLVAAACGDDDGDPGDADAAGPDATAQPSDDGAADAPAADADADAPDDAPAADADEPDADEPDTDAADEPDAGGPVIGGTLVTFRNGDTPTLDPVKFRHYHASTVHGHQALAIFDILFWWDPLEGNVKPGIGETITSDDGVTWTITIKPGITFTDGTPYDAAAIKYNWERFLDPENAAPLAARVGQIVEMNVIDDTTLEVVLTRANAQFDELVAELLGLIGSPTAMEELGPDFGANPVGAGPFVMDEWIRDSQLTVVRNPDYWDAPKPYLDAVVFRFIPDATSQEATWDSGEGDVRQISSSPVLADLLANDEDHYRVITNGGALWSFNNNEPPFDDVRMRKAVIAAFDQERYVDVYQSGFGVPAYTLFQETSPLHNGVRLYDSNKPELAQQLVNDYVADHGGPVNIQIHTIASRLTQQFAEFTQAQLLQLDNVEVEIIEAAQAEHAGKMFTGQYTGFGVWGHPTSHIGSFYDAYYCGQFTNTSGYCDPDMDAALDAAVSTLDIDQQRAQMEIVSTLLARDNPDFAFIRYSVTTDWRPYVKDIRITEDGAPMYNEAWLDR